VWIRTPCVPDTTNYRYTFSIRTFNFLYARLAFVNVTCTRGHGPAPTDDDEENIFVRAVIVNTITTKLNINTTVSVHCVRFSSTSKLFNYNAYYACWRLCNDSIIWKRLPRYASTTHGVCICESTLNRRLIQFECWSVRQLSTRFII